MFSAGVTTNTYQNVLPNFLDSTSTDIAAFVGVFEKGPIDKPIFINSAIQFKEIFGRATKWNYNDWYQVYNYLQYSNKIWVTRSAGKFTFNASTSGSLNFLINNKDDFYNNIANIKIPDNEYFEFIAKTPGSWGNILSVGFITKLEYDLNVEVYKGHLAQDLFTFFEDSYFGIIIFRKNIPIEIYYKSWDEIDEINTESRYIYLKKRTESLRNAMYDENYNSFNGNTYFIEGEKRFIDGNYDFSADGLIYLVDGNYHYIDGNEYQELIRPHFGETIIKLYGGEDSYPDKREFAASHEIYYHLEDYNFDLFIGNDIANELAVELAEHRRDCIAYIAIPAVYLTFYEFLHFGNKNILHSEDQRTIAVTKELWGIKNTSELIKKIDEYINTMQESQYVHFTLNSKVQFDKFSNKMIRVNLAGDIAGLKSRQSYVQQWHPGAGMEKGLIKNMEKTYLFFNTKQKKDYHKRGLNFVENERLMTQRTFTTVPSSFNRVNMRYLFNKIEKITRYFLRYYIFEENTLKLRSRIAFEIKRFLIDVKTSRGITWGRVEVHPDKKDPHAIVIDVYVRPVGIAEYIQLRMKNIGTNTISDVLSNTITA